MDCLLRTVPLEVGFAGCVDYNGRQPGQEIEIMKKKKKSREFAAQISTKKVSKNDALYTYNSSFMKTLKYPIAATRLTED